jgi:hypothetical protein
VCSHGAGGEAGDVVSVSELTLTEAQAITDADLGLGEHDADLHGGLPGDVFIV